MERKQAGTLDMTEGSPARVLLLFAVPVILSNLFQQLYNLVRRSSAGIVDPFPAGSGKRRRRVRDTDGNYFSAVSGDDYRTRPGTVISCGDNHNQPHIPQFFHSLLQPVFLRLREIRLGAYRYIDNADSAGNG